MLSVIIPTYNGIDTLRKSLPTWLAQQMGEDEYEVIVADNRSADDTRSYVEGLMPSYGNLQYIYEPTPGATAARHAGARAAKGAILVFADNDGLFNTECLEKIREVYELKPECEAVTGRIELLWDKEEPGWIKPYRFLLGQLNYGDEIRYDYDLYLNGGLMSVKKATFERLHGFNPDLVGKHLIGDGDTGFVKKLFAEHCLIGYTPFAVMQHLQQVDKHGSVKGIALHFYNNGIADSYSLYREEGFRLTGKVFRHFIKEAAISAKQWVKLHTRHRNDKHLYFTLRQHAGCLHFFLLLLNPELRREIQVKDVYNA